MKNIRLNFLDITKGISIILVVLGHTIPNQNNIIRMWLYSFHMPIFFIVSGYLLQFSNNKYTLKQFIIRKIKTLILPYFSLAIINYFFLMIIAWRDDYFSTQLAINYIIYIFKLCGRSAIWFLPCIFISETSFKLINENISNTVIKILIIFSIFATPFFIKAEPDTLLLVLLRSCTAIGFIAVGNYIFNMIIKYNLSNKQIVLVLLINIALTYINGSVDLFELKFGNPVYYIINSIIGSFAIISISKQIEKNNFLEHMGKNSLIIMGTHIILIQMYRIFFEKILNFYLPILYNYSYAIITLAMVIPFEYIIIYIFNTYLSFLLGKYKKKPNKECSVI